MITDSCLPRRRGPIGDRALTATALGMALLALTGCAAVIRARAVADGFAVGDDIALDPGRSRSRPACPDQVDA